MTEEDKSETIAKAVALAVGGGMAAWLLYKILSTPGAPGVPPTPPTEKKIGIENIVLE